MSKYAKQLTNSIWTIRIKTKNGVLKSYFTTEEALERAVAEFRGLKNRWFIAETTDDQHGRVVEEFNTHCGEGCPYASKILQRGAYQSTKWREYFESYEEARKRSDSINSAGTCWANLTASSPKIKEFGNENDDAIFYIDITDPYKD